MGVGTPSKEIIHLLNHRGMPLSCPFQCPFPSPTPSVPSLIPTAPESFFQRISAIVSFIDTSPLFPVSDQNTYYL
ncbi:MAG: hypothetical protein Q9201_004328, partial [Fulgogasparrea decipioides]